MPMVRARVAARLEATLADGHDPMTLVAQGAALYAATAGLDGRATQIAVPAGRQVWLQYPAVSADLTPHVVGKFVGDDPPASLRARATRDIVVAGHVDDIEPLFVSARLSIAPLRYGAGVKGKVNLAMSYGVPVVATSTAVEGMHLANRIDVLVADHPQTFADAIIDVYGNEALWTRLSKAGVDNIRRHFSREAAKRALAGLLGVDGRAPRSAG